MIMNQNESLIKYNNIFGWAVIILILI